MKKGFYTIMSAQFFSSLADNALFVAAMELLRHAKAPEWQAAALVPMFAFFYVILAPFVGPFADAIPKGRVMFISNLIKVVGCLMMLFGTHPLIAYAVVGLGAAAYSPAKYGILTELLPPSQLVKANGWIEGLTIASIILGVLLGGQLIDEDLWRQLKDLLLGGLSHFLSPWAAMPPVAGLLDALRHDAYFGPASEVAIGSLIFVYALAALFNLRIPRTSAPLQPIQQGFFPLVTDFSRCNGLLWRDKLGQISLATTTLFWGVSGNMRYIVFAWAYVALSTATQVYDATEASKLVGVVAIGTAVGAVVASMKTRLHQATSVIPLGIGMGLLVLALNVIRSEEVAIPFLIALGGLGGYLVVPMNALLQHRGHSLMGAGRSIAVQNFNEQSCILILGALYASVTGLGFSPYVAISIFGLVVAGTMLLIMMWHKHNLVAHRDEVERLLLIARSDPHDLDKPEASPSKTGSA